MCALAGVTLALTTGEMIEHRSHWMAASCAHVTLVLDALSTPSCVIPECDKILADAKLQYLSNIPRLCREDDEAESTARLVSKECRSE